MEQEHFRLGQGRGAGRPRQLCLPGGPLLLHSCGIDKEVKSPSKSLTSLTQWHDFAILIRFIEVEDIHNAQLILVVGAVGLGVNIIGLFLFHGTTFPQTGFSAFVFPYNWHHCRTRA